MIITFSKTEIHKTALGCLFFFGAISASKERTNPLNYWCSALLTDHGPLFLKVLTNGTVHNFKNKAMHKSAEADFVTGLFAATAAASGS